MKKLTTKPGVGSRAQDADRDVAIRPGVHPIWAGVGAAGGAIAGVVIGAVAGPFSAVLGLMACALAGGLAGRGVAEKMEPAMTDTSSDKYSDASRTAYRTRGESSARDRGKKYLEVESGFAARLREVQTFQSNLG